MKTEAMIPEAAPEAGATPSRNDGLPVRIATGIVAAVLLALALSAPIWRSNLTAPQYPDGLKLVAYGDRVEGDTREIDTLNHYVGMRPYRVEDFPEMELWVPALAAGLVAVGLSVVSGRRWLGRLSRLGLWILPLAALVDVQLRLYQFGHDLDPGAPIRLEPFTPLAVGPTRVMNFSVLSFPGEALLYVWGAAAVLSLGPWVVRRTVAALRG